MKNTFHATTKQNYVTQGNTLYYINYVEKFCYLLFQTQSMALALIPAAVKFTSYRPYDRLLLINR